MHPRLDRLDQRSVKDRKQKIGVSWHRLIKEAKRAILRSRDAGIFMSMTAPIQGRPKHLPRTRYVASIWAAGCMGEETVATGRPQAVRTTEVVYVLYERSMESMRRPARRRATVKTKTDAELRDMEKARSWLPPVQPARLQRSVWCLWCRAARHCASRLLLWPPSPSAPRVLR